MRWTAAGAAVCALVGVVVLHGPKAGLAAPAAAAPTGEATAVSATWAPAPVMPDLVGLSAAAVGARVADLDIALSVGLPVVVRCEARPGTVARQRPPAGTRLRPGASVEIRMAALDVGAFRGPCAPDAGDLGPVHGPDAALARAFYRFAADPSSGGSLFVAGDVWTGIEDGIAETVVRRSERADLDAWRLDALYAERSGPFSALDLVAASGGSYEVHDGVAPTCGFGGSAAPAGLAGLRAVSLTAPADTTAACMDWWGVTLFLDGADRVRGVALRLGAP
jgi:hypothetical protein